MSKKKLDLDGLEEPEVVQPSVKAAVEQPQNHFPNSALSIARVGNEYKLVEVRYNLETGDTSEIKELESRYTREEAIEQFKLKVVKEGFFG
jgi:hypothetical protein